MPKLVMRKIGRICVREPLSQTQKVGSKKFSTPVSETGTSPLPRKRVWISYTRPQTPLKLGGLRLPEEMQGLLNLSRKELFDAPSLLKSETTRLRLVLDWGLHTWCAVSAFRLRGRHFGRT